MEEGGEEEEEESGGMRRIWRLHHQSVISLEKGIVCI